jgi:hypothetical protein
MGFGGKEKDKKDEFFGNGEGKIWMEKMKCNGNETGIVECMK